MNIPDYQHQQNLKDAEELTKQGYIIDWSADGYAAWFKDKYLGGGTVRLPRAKPLHWKHRDANIRDNFDSAVRLARQHSQQEAEA